MLQFNNKYLKYSRNQVMDLFAMFHSNHSIPANPTNHSNLFLYLCTMNTEQHKDLKGRAEALRRYL
jgi:hypothetical protein